MTRNDPQAIREPSGVSWAILAQTRVILDGGWTPVKAIQKRESIISYRYTAQLIDLSSLLPRRRSNLRLYSNAA